MPEKIQNAQVAPEGAAQPSPAELAMKHEIMNETAGQETEEQLGQEPDKLPDEDGETANLKSEYEKKQKGLQEQLKKAESERETSDKRLRDTQHKLHMLTAEQKVKGKEEKEGDDKPGLTFDEYVEGVVSKFEDSPTDAIKQIVHDFASDRDTMKQQHKKESSELREAILRELHMSIPENAKHMAKVEELNTVRPDLANFTLNQKIEYVKLMDAAEAKKGGDKGSGSEPSFDRNLIAGGRRNAAKSNGLPDWANDPEVMKQAIGRFKSKREMIDWLDPDKAMKMATQAAKERVE